MMDYRWIQSQAQVTWVALVLLASFSCIGCFRFGLDQRVREQGNGDAGPDTEVDGDVDISVDGGDIFDAEIPDADSEEDVLDADEEVELGTPVALRFVESSETAWIGFPMEGLAVELLDASGERCLGCTPTAVTLEQLETPTRIGDISGSLTTVSTLGGVASFADIIADRLGPGYQLRASAPSLSPVDGDEFNVWLFDGFDDDDVNRFTWIDWHTPGYTSETGGRLNVIVDDFVHSGLETVDAFDFTDSTAQLEVVETLPMSSSVSETDATFCLAYSLDLSWRYCMGAASEQLTAIQNEAGSVQETASAPYDPREHRFWRIRHVEDGPDTMLYHEYSSDGLTWTILLERHPLMVVSSMRLYFGAGWYSGDPFAASAVFDNIMVVPNDM